MRGAHTATQPDLRSPGEGHALAQPCGRAYLPVHTRQTRYEALTGWKAPAAGGSIAEMLTREQRLLDFHARQTITYELGHERLQVTAVYLGR